MTKYNTTHAAFFISPSGETIWVENRHISTVIKNPERFGLTKDEIVATYRKYGERVGLEGRARKEILTRLMRNGWIRIRRYPNQWWIVNVTSLTEGIWFMLSEWAPRVLMGVNGYKELDRHMPVRIVDHVHQEYTTVQELAEIKS